MNRLITAAVVCAAFFPVNAQHSLPALVKDLSVNAQLDLRKSDSAIGVRAVDEAAGNIWRSSLQCTYFWDGTWVPDEIHSCSYTPEGYLAREISDGEEGSTMTDYTWNEDGRWTQEFTTHSVYGDVYENYRKVEREYDARLTSVIVSNFDWLWIDNDWEQRGNNYTRTITRDASGNITSVVIAVLYNGIFDPTQRLTVEYGSDGVAYALTQEFLTLDAENEFVWETEAVYADIVWENTDGQIYDIERLTSGSNRIKSAVVKAGPQGGEEYMEFEYYPDDMGYKAKFSQDGSVYSEVEMRLLDDFGSYTFTQTDYEDDGTMVYSEREEIDAFGHIMLQEYSEAFDGEVEASGRLVGHCTYDEAYGYPLEYYQEVYDDETDSMMPVIKIEYLDYVDVTSGIAGVEADVDDAPVEYFNLRGIRVMPDALTPGIYLRRQATRISKVYIR